MPEDIDHILDSAETPEEENFEETLRPKKFTEYVGQKKAKEGLDAIVNAEAGLEPFICESTTCRSTSDLTA